MPRTITITLTESATDDEIVQAVRSIEKFKRECRKEKHLKEVKNRANSLHDQYEQISSTLDVFKGSLLCTESHAEIDMFAEQLQYLNQAIGRPARILSTLNKIDVRIKQRDGE